MKSALEIPNLSLALSIWLFNSSSILTVITFVDPCELLLLSEIDIFELTDLGLGLGLIYNTLNIFICSFCMHYALYVILVT